VQSVHPLLEIFIINFYISPQTKKIFNAIKSNIQGWILTMMLNKPKALWIISGDFNSKTQPFKDLIPTATPEFTFMRKQATKTISSVTDWTMTMTTTKFSSITSMTNFSDHITITNTFKCNSQNRNTTIMIPNKRLALKNCFTSEINAQNFSSFLNTLKELSSRTQTNVNHRIRIFMKEKHRRSLSEILQQIEQDLFNGNAKDAFKMIKNMTILNPQKRDGGIMTCIKSQDNTLIVDREEVLESCLNELNKIQTKGQYNPITPIKDLAPIKDDMIEYLQSKISSGKGITFDYFSDTWFHTTKRTDLINNLWCTSTFKLMPNLGESRLIPLNKVWPAIPTAPQFRPITILSPVFKWLESRFLPKLNEYLLNKMMKEQTGFVPGFGTHVNIRKLIREIKRYRKNDKMIVIFIDYKSAYNTVNRQILYKRIKDKKILDEDELSFLESLHSLIHYKCKDQIHYYQNGVPQGSMTSPALFDIYSEILLEHIKILFPEISIYAYADDMAFILNESIVTRFTTELRKMSKQLNLTINESKSGIMRITKNKTKQPETIETLDGFPYVDSYKYLGITISCNGNIQPHINTLNSTCNYLANHIKWFAKDFSIKTKCYLWKCFIRPHLLYTFCVTDLIAKTTHINKLIRLWKKTFKQICGFPRNTPDSIIEKFTDSPSQWMNYFTTLADIKCNQRFMTETDKKMNHPKKPDKISKETLKQIPDLLPKMFLFNARLCPIHHVRLDHRHFCKHIKLDYDTLIDDLFADCPQQFDSATLNQKIGIEYLKLHILLKEQKIVSRT